MTVVTFKWKTPRNYRCEFGPDTVNVLERGVDRGYPDPHRFVCFTDDPAGIDASRVEVLPLWNDYADVPSPHGGHNPSCYRRLKLFSPEIRDILGDRFVWLDLDAVVVGDLRPLWNRSEDFVIWGDTNPTTPYNGSMCLMTAGARPQVWTDFDPKQSPIKARAARFFGSDQGWISFKLGPHETKWGQHDGVYSYRNHIAPSNGRLPENARIVFFHGAYKPWDLQVQRRLGHEWIRDHYTLHQEQIQ